MASIKRAGWQLRILQIIPRFAPAGLYPLNNPTPDSPLWLTVNNGLSVQRVNLMLAGQPAWLLVLDSGGLDVPFAIQAGVLTSEVLLEALKTVEQEQIVRHKTVNLPAVCRRLPALRQIEALSGWQPGLQEPIPGEEIQIGRALNRSQQARIFPMRQRLKAALVDAAWSTLLLALPMLIVTTWRGVLPFVLIAVWSGFLILAGAFPWLPGSSSLLKSLLVGLIAAIGLGAATILTRGNWMEAAGRAGGLLALSAWIGHISTAPWERYDGRLAPAAIIGIAALLVGLAGRLFL